jgi:hypothetical protein
VSPPAARGQDSSTDSDELVNLAYDHTYGFGGGLQGIRIGGNRMLRLPFSED